MTAPEPVAPVPIGWPENQLVWCSGCGEHFATAKQPLCPVCADEKRRAA